MTARMEFGFLYDMRNPGQWQKPWPELYSEALEFIAWTEQLGFDGAWVPEHHCTEDGYMSSPLIALTAIAARTSRMKIGTGVALAPFYHPVRFAEDCAVLDNIANGRLEIGLALGYRRRETDAYGVDFPSRVSRTDEFLGIVRKLWAGEVLSHHGRHFNLKNASIVPKPPRGHIPLFVGGYSEKAMNRVARYGDGYLGSIELYDAYRRSLSACGKEPDSGRLYLASMPLVVARDPEQAMHELAPYYHHVNNAYGIWLNEDQYAGRVDVGSAPAEMSLEDFKVSGLLQILTPQQAIARIKAMRAQAPVEHVMMTVPPGIPLAKFSPYVELFAHEVMPHV